MIEYRKDDFFRKGEPHDTNLRHFGGCASHNRSHADAFGRAMDGGVERASPIP